MLHTATLPGLWAIELNQLKFLLGHIYTKGKYNAMYIIWKLVDLVSLMTPEYENTHYCENLSINYS